MWRAIFTCFAVLGLCLEARKIGDIHWQSDNTIFEVSNTDHVMNVNIGDRVSIKCPNPESSEKYEYSYIYMVSEEEYNHCYLANPRLVGACDNETTETSVNIVFRSFTPTPGGFEFQPGKTYYLISTSDGTIRGIDRKKDGLCLTKQMKIKFIISPTEQHRGQESPKFAARMLKKDTNGKNFEDSTPVMYLIHTGKDEEDDDNLSTKCSYIFPLIVLLTYWVF